MSKFWLQTKAPAGNWSDNLGSNEQAACINHGIWLAKEQAACINHGIWLAKEQGHIVRVIERVDTPVWSMSVLKKEQAVGFVIEKAPRGSGMHSGYRHAGVIKSIRGQRITIVDANGYRFVVDGDAVQP